MSERRLYKECRWHQGVVRLEGRGGHCYMTSATSTKGLVQQAQWNFSKSELLTTAIVSCARLCYKAHHFADMFFRKHYPTPNSEESHNKKNCSKKKQEYITHVGLPGWIDTLVWEGEGISRNTDRPCNLHAM